MKVSGLEKGVPLRRIADEIGGLLIGDPRTLITGASSLTEAIQGDIAYATGKRHL